MKYFYTFIAVILVLALFKMASASESNLDSISNSVFEIYATKYLITFNDAVNYSTIVLDTITPHDSPILTTEDIESYDTANHFINLNKNLDDSEFPYTPTNGHMFVVGVNGQRIYCGFFWTLLSSGFCNWVVITNIRLSDTQIHIELGYPGEIVFEGIDPRNNPVIIDALDKNGLLTGISERRAEFLKIYPNPTNGIVNISGLKSVKDISVIIYNEGGKLLNKNILTDSKINLSNNSSGIYYLQLYTDKKFAGTFKIIKQ